MLLSLEASTAEIVAVDGTIPLRLTGPGGTIIKVILTCDDAGALIAELSKAASEAFAQLERMGKAGPVDG